jgi:hypothetical protein
VSVTATGLVILFAGLIVFRALVCDSGLRAAVVCAVISALSIGSFVPIQLFSALMRVDMLALAFGFVGVSLGLQALKRPRLVHLAALCFVAGAFTKQTMIAAPTATFLFSADSPPQDGVCRHCDSAAFRSIDPD